MTAFYNEMDPVAAQWLRNLIASGHIAPGVVDERSIEDISQNELSGFTQCHFFAGIGVWSYSLRSAGWPDDRPVWTGSCPCQPFSDAGKGAGFADERHLWPAFFHLIGHHRPAVVFGEQVASSNAMPWLDLVQDDLEAVGYAFGAIPFPSAGVGAPHIRDRLYWVADEPSNRRGQERSNARGVAAGNREQGRTSGLEPGRMSGLPGNGGNEGFSLGIDSWRNERSRPGQAAVGAGVHAGELANCGSERRLGRQGVPAGREHDGADAGRIEGDDGSVSLREAGDASRPAGPTNGFWRAADWLLCRDNKWRPVEPGSFPLAHGAPQRVGRLRAYGNAVNAEAARVFIESYMTR